MKSINQSSASEILARLLSSERITLIRCNDSTASFDIANRVLRLPNWTDMNNEEEVMLVLHEIGHALFTTYEDYKPIFHDEDLKHLGGYCNIIEDARIEALVKNRYPGSRKQFAMGYTSLHNKDFFGVKNRDINKLLPIDKLNLHFKIGALNPISLTEDEQGFADRIVKVKTIAEVIELAKEIYDYSKQQESETESDLSFGHPEQQEGGESGQGPQQMPKNMKEGEESEDSEGSMDGGGSGRDGEESDDTTRGRSAGKGKDDRNLAPETNDNFASRLEQNVDKHSRIYYVDSEPTYKQMFDDIIVSYKTVLADIDKDVKLVNSTGNAYYYHNIQPFKVRKQVCAKFKRNNAPFVSYLIKEFEMKKAATAYKRAQVSRTGSLDVRKLYAYKLKDDLFKSTIRTATEKNHGMLFLMDWSGSMNDNIHETIQQVICLASFCYKASIPFQVLAFTDGYQRRNREAINTAKVAPNNLKGLTVGTFNLIEFLTHTMSPSEFNRMCEALLSKFYKKNQFHNYDMCGTPLNEAMLYMIDYVGEFKAKHGIEKMSVITLSDGEGGRLVPHQSHELMTDKTRTFDSPMRLIMTDTKTKRQYDFGINNSEQVEVFNQILKDRYDAKVISFFLCKPSASDVYRWLRSNSVGSVNDNSMRDRTAIEIAKTMARDSFGYLAKTAGFDEVYFVNVFTKMVDLEEKLEAFDGDQDMVEVEYAAKKFTEALTTSRKSRILLDRFIQLIA